MLQCQGIILHAATEKNALVREAQYPNIPAYWHQQCAIVVPIIPSLGQRLRTESPSALT